MNEDAIAWFVYVLGTDKFIELVGQCKFYDVSQRGPLKSQFRSGVGLSDGIYFDGAHYYCVKNGKKTDSYALDYQIKGTAHLCQTFALMIYLGADANMIPGDYDGNFKKAVQFWLTTFENDENIRKMFLFELFGALNEGDFQSLLDNMSIPGTLTSLKGGLNQNQLKVFLEAVQNNSNTFYKSKTS